MSIPETTTGHRTHRYLRLSLVVIVVAIGVAIGIEIAREGGIRHSISDYFYSPARNVIVAGLISVSLALVALAGRDRESAVLNVAAIFAPLIAIVPTGFDGSDTLPAEYLADVHNGVWTYGIIVLLVAAIAVALVLGRQIRPLGTLVAAGIAVAVVIAVWLVAFVPPLNTGFPFNPALGLSVHYLVTVIFFGLVIVVSILNALPRERALDAPPLTITYRLIYLTIPALLVIDVVAMFLLDSLHPDASAIFFGEAVALVLFAAFWLTQTIERWTEADQASIVAPRTSEGGRARSRDTSGTGAR